MLGTFTYNGKNSWYDFGLYILEQPKRPIAERMRSSISIAGRNGNVIIDDGSYNNATVQYKVGFKCEQSEYAQRAHDVIDWLYSVNTYSRLEDDFDDDCYRMAVPASGSEIEGILAMWGECTITFSCTPQSFLKSGAIEIYGSALPEGATFTFEQVNPTQFDASPLIRISMAGGHIVSSELYYFKLSSGGVEFIFDGVLSKTDLFIDTEKMIAYDSEGNNRTGEFILNTQNRLPVIPPNESLTISDVHMSEEGEDAPLIYMTPRWWKL